MMEVTLTIRIPDAWISEISPFLDRPVTVLQAVPDGELGGRGLIEIRGDDRTTTAVVEAIRAHPSVCHVEFVPLPEGGVLGEVITSKCAACRALTGVDCFLLSAVSRADGRVDWNLITGGEGSLRELVERLVSEGCEVEVKRSRRPEMHRPLTDRQEQVLRLALESGYYDQPKRVTIKDLARKLGISPSTYQETLQRAERKVMLSSLDH
jgi:predicted DNA binding protein